MVYDITCLFYIFFTNVFSVLILTFSIGLQFIYCVNSHGSKTAKNIKKVILVLLPTITSSKCQRDAQ